MKSLSLIDQYYAPPLISSRSPCHFSLPRNLRISCCLLRLIRSLRPSSTASFLVVNPVALSASAINWSSMTIFVLMGGPARIKFQYIHIMAACWKHNKSRCRAALGIAHIRQGKVIPLDDELDVGLDAVLQTSGPPVHWSGSTDFYLVAASSTFSPAFCISLPTPLTVLHAVNTNIIEVKNNTEDNLFINAPEQKN